jgi:hypothetical protein
MICPVCNNKIDLLGIPPKEDPHAGGEKGRFLCPQCGVSLRIINKPVFGIDFRYLSGMLIGVVILANYLNYTFFQNNDIVTLIFNVGGILLFLYLYITYMNKYTVAVEAEKSFETLEESDQAIKNISSAATEAIFKGDEGKKKNARMVLRVIIIAIIIFSVIYRLYKFNPQGFPGSLGFVFLTVAACGMIMWLVKKHMK